MKQQEFMKMLSQEGGFPTDNLPSDDKMNRYVDGYVIEKIGVFLGYMTIGEGDIKERFKEYSKIIVPITIHEKFPIEEWKFILIEIGVESTYALASPEQRLPDKFHYMRRKKLSGIVNRMSNFLMMLKEHNADIDNEN